MAGLDERTKGTQMPEMTTIPTTVLDELLEAGKELADEVAIQTDRMYPSRESQPVQSRRYVRDMVAVDEFMKAHDEMCERKWE